MKRIYTDSECKEIESRFITARTAVVDLRNFIEDSDMIDKLEDVWLELLTLYLNFDKANKAQKIKGGE